jgi:AraC-like DNA-binding protein
MMGDSEADLLLSDRFVKVSTSDLREASAAIERLQGPFKARPKAGHSAGVSPIRVRAASCGKVALSTFSFGSNVDIEPKGLEGAILVTTAVRGRAGMAVGGQIFGAAAGSTFISQEEDRPVFLYDPDTEVLKLRFERRRMEEACMKMYDCLPRAPLHFDSVMALPQAAQRWQALLRFVVASVNAADELEPNPLATSSTEELLMLTLLSIQTHNYDASRGARVRTVSPRQFRLAVDYIHEHLDTDITLTDIAAAAGCSIRSLARTFQHAGDASPMQYLQQQRLQRIRSELVRAQSANKNIAEIAYRWGCRHLGEFNRKYRECFGETPSETRQRHLVNG